MAETTNNGTLITKKVNDLAENTSPADTDVFIFGNAGTNAIRRITWANIVKAMKEKLAKWTFENLSTKDKTIPGALEELNTNMQKGFKIYKNLNELGFTTNDITTDDIITKLKDGEAISFAFFKFDIPNLSIPISGARCILTINRPTSGYVYLQAVDIDNNVVWHRTHNGYNYTEWK